ncbi:Pyruvate dehydrogenase protein X component, mitochondrial [Nymphon striatum]|nr:Pyruvate dehydrogenase protein X component, mitochondrial [Nymphon striatum]
MCLPCTNELVIDLGNYRYPFEKIGECPTQHGKKDPRRVVGRQIKMPSLSPTMTEGTIVKWLKQEGDAVSPGDVLCEIQTDKAVVAMDIEEEGIMAKILISEDTNDIKVGTLIALMVDEGENYKDVEIPIEEASTTSEEVKSDSINTVSKDISGLKMGPAAKNLLDLYNLKASDVPASGPRHTLSKSDVLSYVESNKLQPKDMNIFEPLPASAKEVSIEDVSASPPARNLDFEDIDVSSMRRTIAKRLTQSKTTIPHSYGSITCTLDNILNLRKLLKDEGIKVSVNDFIIKSAAIALKCQKVNSQWTDNGQVKQFSNVDVSIAVATDSGLITPIVKDASSLGIESISNHVKELAGRARIGKLLPEEFIGGTFSISNLGMFGISEFSAVINPPQAAILAIGTSEILPVCFERSESKKISSKTIMTVTLSYDTRVITEEASVRFLRIFKKNMEDPFNNLLDGPKTTAMVASLL